MDSDVAGMDIVTYLHEVQVCVHNCLRTYMSRKEAVDELLTRANIKPCFTELVWQRLEEENEEFFSEYNRWLMVKGQILRYNELHNKQGQLNQLLNQARASFPPLPHGSQSHPMRMYTYLEPHVPSLNPQNMSYLQPHVPSINPENMSSVTRMAPNPNVNTARTYSEQHHFQAAANMPSHAGRMTSPTDIALVHNSNGGTVRGFNNRTFRTEGVCAGNLPVMSVAPDITSESHNVNTEYGGRVNFPTNMALVGNSNLGTVQGFNKITIGTEGVYDYESLCSVEGGEDSPQEFVDSMLKKQMNPLGVEQMVHNKILSELMDDSDDEFYQG